VCAGSGNVDGSRYYQVRAVDNDGLRSAESNYDGVNITNDNPYPYGMSPSADSLAIDGR